MGMKEYDFCLAGSLEKVFPDRIPERMKEGDSVFILKGEVPAVQAVYRRRPEKAEREAAALRLRVKGFPTKARLRDVELVPSAFPCFPETDDNYLSKKPGLFPDLLLPNEEGLVKPVWDQYRAVWIDFPDTAGVAAGSYEVEVALIREAADAPADQEADGGAAETDRTAIGINEGSTGMTAEKSRNEADALRLHFTIEVAEAALPEQRLIRTEWFHADCLADYYHTEVFGELHWKAVENQIRLAAELGINMLLTPVFTPPLDTEVGGERTTVQLVEIDQGKDGYRFHFEKLRTWCAICRKYGIRYLEIPHLFTQWGAHATPKIIVNGEKRFGWHVPADSPLYREFLEAFLPALQEELSGLGYGREQIYFHISDEPSAENMESYRAARATVEDLLEGWQVIDALSDYDFYRQGLVKRPIPSNDHIQAFVDHGVKGLWTYYCCAQGNEVPNRFFAMPSARNRIMGVLMYLYDIEGFLQWGFNFYNTALSREHIDPFFNTHAGYSFPSGDAFLVYPGPDGEPYSSLRGEVMREALYDLRALRRLEERVGREAVEELIYDGKKRPFTFRSYPKEASYLYELRKKLFQKLSHSGEE